jgi:long-chain acyl-CoA synthetase
MGQHTAVLPPGGSALHNLADLVTRAATRHAARCAFVAGAERSTWADFDEAVSQRAGALAGLGLLPGERVALMLPNTPDFPLHYFAALRAQLVVVPVNTGYTAPELRHVLGDSGAAALITDDAGSRTVAAIRAELTELRHVLSPDALTTDGDAPPPGRGGEDLAVLIYTSGTSGRPKGAMLSHRAMLANLEQLGAIEPVPVTERDIVLLVLPLFHIYGLNVGLGMQAWAGATGVLVERFDPQGCLRLMAAERVSTLVGVPPMYVVWSRADPGDLRRGFADVRVALSGAAPLPVGALAAIRDLTGVGVYEGYGLTETAPVLTSTLVGGRSKPGSIGRPVPGVELALWDDDGQPVDLDDGEDTGQIAVRGPNVFAGYWPDGHDGPDSDGWLATGDIGFLDDEGDLHLIDRRGDLILVSGFNVYPQEVEAVLLAHPGVRDVAVVGTPDELTGEAVRAIVVPEPAADPSADELIEHSRRSLARFKCPSAVTFVPALPHSVTGKVSRSRLRELGFG